MSKHFGQIVVCDFEYETSGGEYQLVAGDLPKPLCMVAYVLNGNLEYVHTIKLWRGNFGPKPPFDIGPDTLFVGYSTWAELTCFLVLGWKFPQHIFDLHTAYLAESNILRPYDPDEIYKKPRKRLPDACRAYGIKGWENIDKEAMSKDIGEGRWRDYGQEAILDYCQADVDASVKLLRAQVRSRIDSDLVLHWSNYSGKVVAQVQARGMLIDMELWNLVQENKAAVILDLLRQFDPSFGSANSIYNLDGSTSYDQLERWLTSAGVTAWPHLESGKLDTRGDAFRLMYHVPGIEGLHALRDSLRVITGASLPIGRDGRNRPSLFPFGTTTGRNAHARSLYNAHAGMRSFMVFPPDKIGVYLDWRTQEVAVAASRSEDQALINAYLGGDVYYAFARDSGLTTDPDQIHWKKHDKPMRQRVKALQLAVNYGIGVPSLAKGLDRHPLIASYLIEKHRRMYPCFWQWREDQVQIAMLDRRLESVFGWPLHLSTSPNKRTLYNFPMQSGGAEMLRLAAWRLCEAGLIPNMLVHDAILLELDNEEQVAHAIEIMRKAGQDVCDGLDVGVDVNQLLKHGERYQDDRPMAQKMWKTIMSTLENIGAMPKQAAS
jgi:DNA polymerase family A